MLGTDRLSLYEITLDDLDDLCRLDSDPEVMKYIGPTRSREEIESRLDQVMAYYRKNEGLGVWILRLKSNNEFIGWGCLKHLDDSAHIEVGYRLLKAHWGKGYATEFSKMIIDYGFSEMGLKEIVGITHPENLASQRVLQKIGMEYQRMARFYDGEVRYFSISNDK